MASGVDGNIYGISLTTVFSLTPSGALTTLYTFTGGTDGAIPCGVLTQTSDGDFYGVTNSGGDPNAQGSYGWGAGTVFRITPSGKLTTVYTFTAGADGGWPTGGLTLANDGSLYGTTGGFPSIYAGWSASTNAGTLYRIIPPPVLTKVSPASATTAAQAPTVTLSGADLVSGCVVRWSDGWTATTLPSTWSSPTQVAATIPASALTTAGQYSLWVDNPGGSSSAALAFAVENPAPSLWRIRPDEARAGSAGATVTLTGAGFMQGCRVWWFNGLTGTTLPSTYVSPTHLIVSIPPGDLAAAGTFQIRVDNPGPGAPASNAWTFTVLPRK
jgi:uncharacterized repeat protein (TIGR03803 family)